MEMWRTINQDTYLIGIWGLTWAKCVVQLCVAHFCLHKLQIFDHTSVICKAFLELETSANSNQYLCSTPHAQLKYVMNKNSSKYLNYDKDFVHVGKAFNIFKICDPHTCSPLSVSLSVRLSVNQIVGCSWGNHQPLGSPLVPHIHCAPGGHITTYRVDWRA